jgi:hypothetical protein
MSLIGQGLQQIGVPVVTRPFLLEELKSMRAAAAMYSVCYRQPIGSINGWRTQFGITSTTCCSGLGLPCPQTTRSGR